MSVYRDPGFYDYDGAGTALVEQQRAGIIEALRTTKAASVTMLAGSEGGGLHWGFHADPDSEAAAFLVYVVVRAWRDAIAGLRCDDTTLHEIVQTALDSGLGS